MAHMAKRANQGIKNKKTRSQKTVKRTIAKRVRLYGDKAHKN